MEEETKNNQEEQPKEQTKAAPKKAAPKKVPSLKEAIAQCSTLLVDVPDALAFSVHMNENNGRHFYAFDNNSKEAQDVRKQIEAILREVYDAGKYSFGDFARPLRVESKAIMAIMDEDFKDEHGL